MKCQLNSSIAAIRSLANDSRQEKGREKDISLPQCKGEQACEAFSGDNYLKRSPPHACAGDLQRACLQDRSGRSFVHDCDDYELVPPPTRMNQGPELHLRQIKTDSGGKTTYDSFTVDLPSM